MSVIVQLTLPAEAFELGRVLKMEGEAEIVLETMVPFGEGSIPFFRLRGGRERFEASVREQPAVDDIHVVNTHGEETLYALDWQVSDDAFFTGVRAMDGHILEGDGGAQEWAFDLRFRSREALSEFQGYCQDTAVPITVQRIYNPTRPDAGPWYGLTVTQRETLTRAVEEGYYSIPRECSTRDLAAELGVSDQAVTERLRRGIDSLVTNTLLLPESADAGEVTQD